MIVKHRQKKYEEELKEKQEKERQKKENFKLELDHQLAIKKELKNLNFQKENTLESKIREFQSQQETRLSEKNSLGKNCYWTKIEPEMLNLKTFILVVNY